MHISIHRVGKKDELRVTFEIRVNSIYIYFE